MSYLVPNRFRAICLLAVSLALSLHAPAQGALGELLQPKSSSSPSSKTPDSLGRDTPYGTVFGFLEAAQSGKYAIADQYLKMTAANPRRNAGAAA
jgi:hypothetical protein